MRALRLLKWKSDPVLMDVEDPEPGPGQVVVRVGGAGLCRSDLTLMRQFEAGMSGWGPPFTLGHESAGWVHAIGPGVAGWKAGRPVAVHGAWGCGLCPRCRAGIENYCEDPAAAPVPCGGGGLGLDGGMADYLLVPAARHLVALPDGLDPATAAPLTDAGLTSYHAVRRSWAKLRAGSTAVVIGAGGLGHLAVQILKATTPARIIAVGTRESSLELARGCGADDTLICGPDTARLIRRATDGRGADLVLDNVGSDTTLALCAAASRMLGDVTIVGFGGGSLPVSFFSPGYEVSVQTTYWGSRPELVEVLGLAARGLLKPVTTVVPLEEALDAYHRMESGQVAGRVVVDPTLSC